ncbi:V-type proton ATPase subunit C-like [Quercus suber]|uniref:V-type proton ATPase subunit C-like n=1 Tax=Quercus suber TaxID=58331 RepID=UPI0032DF9234
MSTSAITGPCAAVLSSLQIHRVGTIASKSCIYSHFYLSKPLIRFVWDEAKYPTMSPLRETVDSIHSQVSKIEDDLKLMTYDICGLWMS